MAQEAEASQGRGKQGGRGVGGILVPLLLVLVLVALVVVILKLRGLTGGGAPAEGEGQKAAPAVVRMTQIAVCENLTTTNRLQQAVQCTVTLQVRDDEAGSRSAEWKKPENLMLLKAIIIEVIQNIDFRSPRPQPMDLFSSEVRRRVDQLMGEEGAVDRVLVTQWIVMSR